MTRKPLNYTEVLGKVHWNLNDPSPDITHLIEGHQYLLDDKVYIFERDNRLVEVGEKSKLNSLFFCEHPLTGWLYEDVEVRPNYVETHLTKYTVTDLQVLCRPCHNQAHGRKF